MRGIWIAVLLNQSLALGLPVPVLAQAKLERSPDAAGSVRYEALAEGVYEAKLIASDALAPVRVELVDVILGPGKSAPDKAFDGFRVVELKSGEVETTINGQAARRRPGDFWVVGPGQTYTIKNLGGMVVLHVITFVLR
jgi:quercetin dioxygenase-like cupin family protein